MLIFYLANAIQEKQESEVARECVCMCVCAHVCVWCVCVCVREREPNDDREPKPANERERERSCDMRRGENAGWGKRGRGEELSM